MSRFELLSPAGDFSCLTAAFHAGADAVYLAGKSFGARAFAGNFETEELTEALDYAHLLSKKIYLTLNTLIKEKEFSQIVRYLEPFYVHGLDGVIIQDFGLIPLLKKEFPLLELHGSTQMTVSNYRSAAWLKEQGLCRVVPARELSLQELQEIKEKASIEVEAFIHGAMCYSYSGQCLFSSFLGGRSGNRGRCAQPCRLPYKVLENGKCISGNKDVYPLSLKDLCSLPYIYELMDAGIDSFKIEGRMKSPEYVAGVTAVYRKYMDLYECGNRQPIAKADMEQLANLYIRSDMKDGYFKKHNGKDMISLSSPSYQGCDEKLVQQIHSQFCDKKTKQKISGYLRLEADEKAELTIYTDSDSVTVQGDIVQSAQNRPLTVEEVKKQIEKTGNSPFEFEVLDVEIKGNVFLPVKKLNELRREALDCLCYELLQPYMQKKAPGLMAETKQHHNLRIGLYDNDNKKTTVGEVCLRVSVMNETQANAVLNCEVNVDRIYIPADIIYLNRDYLLEIKEKAGMKSCEIFLSLPRMIRKRDDKYLDIIREWVNEFDGVQIKSPEGLAFIKEIGYCGNVAMDHSIYGWNRSAHEFLRDNRCDFAYPLELSVQENRELTDCSGEYIVYGRTPMMISANCIRKTMGICNKNSNSFEQSLQDRYRKELPVYTNCVHCYNEIFNAVPMSLHKELQQLKKYGFQIFRVDYTNESQTQTLKILEYFGDKISDSGMELDFPLKEYTQGHYKEGAI